MARKNVLRYNLETAKTLAASYTTAPTVVKYLDNFSYQIEITTSNSEGTFAVETSNDYSSGGPDEPAANTGTWSALPLGGTPTVAAANDTIMINLNQLPFYAVRLKYTSGTAGTGTMNVIVVAKQIGG